LLTALVGLGLAPRPIVDSQFAASHDILRLRQVRMDRQKASTGTHLDIPRELLSAAGKTPRPRIP
jgi:hypothetical protein